MTFRMGCTVNTAVGAEATLDESLITAASEPRKVLVIGGGPAGMEAARIAALRGHEVVLAEAAKDLGGQVNVAKRAPHLRGLADITHWLEKEIYRLGVNVRLSTYMEADDVSDEKPDAVIVATGAYPREDGLLSVSPGEVVPGMDMAHVLTPTDLFTSRSNVSGQHALIYDDVGHYEALAAAEYLIDKGMEVTFVTSKHMLSQGVIAGSGRMEPVLVRLRSKGIFRLMTYSRIVEIGSANATIAGIRSSGQETVKADVVIAVLHKDPMRELYDDLRETISDLQLIGDGSSPRDLLAAIHDGHKAGRRVIST